MSGLGATHQSWAAAPLALDDRKGVRPAGLRVCRAEDAHRRHHAHRRERSEGEGPGGWHDREEVVDGMAIAIDGVTSHMGLIEPVSDEAEIHFVPAIGGGAWPYARRRVGDARARAAWSRIRGSVASGRVFGLDSASRDQ